MNVLIACEESQTVCKAFRAKGHNAFSCDVIEPSGSYSKKHNDEHRGLFTKDRAKQRLKTFEGIASAMAEQWGADKNE